MIAKYSGIGTAVRQQRVRPTESQFAQFRAALAKLMADIDALKKSAGAKEEAEKSYLTEFLKNTFYKDHDVRNHNYKGLIGADLTIRSKQGNTLVLMEVKSSGNTTEMVTQENLLTKSFLETVLYYCLEKELLGNDHIKHIVITNVRQWFVFDAAQFRANIHGHKEVRDTYAQWIKGNLDDSSTQHVRDKFKAVLSAAAGELPGTHFDLWHYKKFLDRTDEESTRELLKLYRFLAPGFLLKQPEGRDSNQLDEAFYHELLYILGLREKKDGGKKLIDRLPEAERQPASLLEHTMLRLREEQKLDVLPEVEAYGATAEERLFSIALELCITWLDRILFLKLLEAQLLRYHGGDRRFAFLSPEAITQFDQLNALFFSVLAKPIAERTPEVTALYGHIPYLNSSLFEITTLEKHTFSISALNDTLSMQRLPKSVLVKNVPAKSVEKELHTQHYLLRFLGSFDFGSEEGDALRKDDRSLISASVLGLIFEKINGYKEGSFYTPGYITMYMCRETIRRAVLQRFQEHYHEPFSGFEALGNFLRRRYEPAQIREAESLIDGLRICDPAVGSGHFLVSALNELIAVKSELGLLTDAHGKSLDEWGVEVVNDELIVTKRANGEAFVYEAKAFGTIVGPDPERVQSALFEQKRKLIENCLFGVDINPNSVKICRLRLWIELLKSAYYKEDTRELQTLPNIDINIKQGNSLLTRYSLTTDIADVLHSINADVKVYRGFVQDYREASTPELRKGFKMQIDRIKTAFRGRLSQQDPRIKQLRDLVNNIQKLTGGFVSEPEFTYGKGLGEKATSKLRKLEEKYNALRKAVDDDLSGASFHLAFDWRFEFPEVLNDDGSYRGFDVVLGNPPYIRQEEITALKYQLSLRYRTYVSSADLFVYFMELGHMLLAPGGHFCYIVTGGWMRTGYGEKLRKYLADHTLIQLIDFADLPVFEEAITYPCILLTRAAAPPRDHAVQALKMHTLVTDGLAAYVQQEALHIPQRTFVESGYRIIEERSNAVMEKIKQAGMPLGEFTEGKIYRGVLTGYNKAFVLDQATRDQLIAADPGSAEVIKPFLAGKDVKRYAPAVVKHHVIFTRRGIDIEKYPAIKVHLQKFREGLEPRPSDYKGKTEDWPGRKPGTYKWYEIQDSVEYYNEFEKPKIMTPSFAQIPNLTLDESGSYTNNKATVICSSDKWLLAVLNSSVTNYFIRNTSNLKQGGWYDFEPTYLTKIPIAEPDAQVKQQLEHLVTARLAGDTSTEAEIDRLVYALYGLSAEEIAVVEGK